MRRFCVLFGFLLTTNILLAQDTWTLKDIELEMIKCPAGEFLMGSPKGEMGRDLKEIQHKVILSDSFMIGKYEVTQKQYKTVMGKNPSKFKNDLQPVELVNWNDAKEFCEKLNTKFSSSIPSGFKFDLPTEAQWEYACRAGTNSPLNNGKELTTEYKCDNLDEIGWYAKNSKFTTHPVGQKQPNSWGIYDMQGNVSEWCRDYDGSFVEGEAKDPLGPEKGTDRIIKGGNYNVNAKFCRSAIRLNANPKTKDMKTGFRVALIPVGSGTEINFASKTEVPHNIVSQPKENTSAPVVAKTSETTNTTATNSQNNDTKQDWTYSDLNLQMVYCKTGKFKMGSPENELGRTKGSDLDANEVSIDKDFYIGKYEVTQKLFSDVMGEKPSRYADDKKPVESVSYYKAVEFCKKLNELTKDKRPAGYEFALPTEMQWEYACRAGCESSLNNGKQISAEKGNCAELNEIAWYKANSDTKTHEVGTKKANNWNIFDMHGNVAEWCLDGYNGNEMAKEVNNNSKCIVKGGAYFYEPAKNRSASRGVASPNTLSSAIGFRVALVQTEN
ncbi:MAG: formylglycine-generating enzyme family protein [Candidatus Riflebacteria bacterium]|nr:formylglycine-generating enzyme family protein [Candidatus Riflebacteria bacterium]